MNIEELQDKIEGIMTPMPPETYVQYYIDNDLLPKMLIATDDKNKQVRKNKDWLNMKGRAIV